jgi:hypothetical protein
MQKYLEFKKFFQGDKKLNIVALDKNKTVLAHRAVNIEGWIESEIIYKILNQLKEEIKDKNIGNVFKYEITYPEKK